MEIVVQRGFGFEMTKENVEDKEIKLWQHKKNIQVQPARPVDFMKITALLSVANSSHIRAEFVRITLVQQ